MSYGHAERNLALIIQLEAETKQLLARLDQRSGLSAVNADLRDDDERHPRVVGQAGRD
jgi:hypothetical protein